MVGCADYRIYVTLLWEESHHLTDITEIICSLHVFSLHLSGGSAKKRLYEILRGIYKDFAVQKRLLDTNNTGVYDAAAWKEMKSNKLLL
jgi:hypothetical protein